MPGILNRNRIALPLLAALLMALTVALALIALRQPPPKEVLRSVSFEEINWYAGRAGIAYQNEAAIRSAYPATVYVGSPDHTDVLYFLEILPEKRQQIVTIRGTDNLQNALQDAEYLRAEDSALGIAVHRGFDSDTRIIWADLEPRLKRDYDTYLTGHSLGAAVSTLLMMYLQKDGYRVTGSVNFGQPKLTNNAGASAFDALPLTRVVDGKDVVPLLPADTPLDSEGGEYTHLGREVILLDGPYYVFLDRPQVLRVSQGSFWHDLGEESVDAHMVSNYLKRIAEKLKANQQVPYSNREQYLPQ